MNRKPISRPYHDKYETGESEYDLFTNKNAEWINGKFTRIFYVLFIFTVWGVIQASGIFHEGDSWTITNIIHGVVSFSRLFYYCILFLLYIYYRI